MKLYKVGEAYFVLDGNHRVSVAREQGAEYLDAEVLEVTRAGEPDMDADDLEIKGEYADFLERTRLDELLPGRQIEFTSAGGYARLLEHIAVHRYFLGLEPAPDAEDEAVLAWYYDLYRPLVRIIREQQSWPTSPGAARPTCTCGSWITSISCASGWGPASAWSRRPGTLWTSTAGSVCAASAGGFTVRSAAPAAPAARPRASARRRTWTTCRGRTRARTASKRPWLLRCPAESGSGRRRKA